MQDCAVAELGWEGWPWRVVEVKGIMKVLLAVGKKPQDNLSQQGHQRSSEEVQIYGA